VQLRKAELRRRLVLLLLQDPRSTENASAASRSLAIAYSSLGKVLSALRHSAPAAAAAAAPGNAAAGNQLNAASGAARVPWRDSPLTRWLQEHLNKASAISLLGTVSLLPESAADTLATLSWLSRFSSASKSGDGGVLVNFAWDALADPAAPPG